MPGEDLVLDSWRALEPLEEPARVGEMAGGLELGLGARELAGSGRRERGVVLGVGGLQAGLAGLQLLLAALQVGRQLGLQLIGLDFEEVIPEVRAPSDTPQDQDGDDRRQELVGTEPAAAIGVHAWAV
ncbi:MAG TPA: hypothetical protein VMV09_00425 [Candidatus Saccharimonadales bacterium]|nr:hypothetical protein [Candidatus Saccharimonadales bacterium]